MGGQQWESLALNYNRNLPANWPARDSDSLRRKFFSLKNIKKPTGSVASNCFFSFLTNSTALTHLFTGDPKIPPEVRRAKLLHKEIENKSGSAVFDDDEGSEKDEDELTSEKGEKENKSLGGDEGFRDGRVHEENDDGEAASVEEISTTGEGSVLWIRGKKGRG